MKCKKNERKFGTIFEVCLLAASCSVFIKIVNITQELLKNTETYNQIYNFIYSTIREL